MENEKGVGGESGKGKWRRKEARHDVSPIICHIKLPHM